MTRLRDGAPSDYVDWVDHVMKEVAIAYREGTGTTQVLGVWDQEIASRLGVPRHTAEFLPLHSALRELTSLGLLETENHRYYKLSQEGRKFPQTALSSAWGAVFDVFLDEEQESALAALWRASLADQQSQPPALAEIEGTEVFNLMGRPWDGHDSLTRCSALFQGLERAGMVKRRPTLGPPAARLTYVGAVRASREQEHSWHARLRQLVTEWENTNVDFKRQLNLSRDAEKAEFVRDALGLTNTKSPGERHLIIGFDDETHAFHTSIDETITQERLEQILQAWARPAPPLRWEVVPWEGGVVGVATFERVPRLIPHVAVKSAGKLRADVVYARHGSHTEPATELEADELHAEGEAARAAGAW